MRYVAVASSALTGLLVAGWMALAAPPGVINAYNALCDAAFPTRCTTVNTDGTLAVKLPAGASGVTGVKATAADPAYVEGSLSNPMSSDLAGYLRVLDKQGSTPWIVSGAVTQSGTWTVQQGTPPWSVIGTSSAGDGQNGVTALKTVSLEEIYNGTSFDVLREVVPNMNSAGVGIPASGLMGQCDDVSPTVLTENNWGNARIDCTNHAQLTEGPLPTPNAYAGIAPIFSANLEGQHAMKASPGNLYGAQVSTTSVAGYLLVLNAISTPGDGAVVPVAHCYVPAFGTCGLNFSPPLVMTTGIVLVFSSATTPFTKTASATAAFMAQVQ